MINFSCIFDVKKDIVPFVIGRRKSLALHGDHDPQIHVVGQEQDGCLLYTWVDSVPGSAGNTSVQGLLVTHFGIYEPVTRSNQTVFIHDQLVSVVNCSISQEHTFLGFVTVQQETISQAVGKKKQDVYKAFLAEVSPQNRTFDLNLERSHYLRVAFLYGRYKGQATARESHMLIFLHKESIGLYHVPVARLGGGVIMSGEPKKEQIFPRKFLWSQWDHTHQRLYVAHFRKVGRNSNGQALHKPFLTAFQFGASIKKDHTIEVPLDGLAVPHIKSSSRSQYLDMGPNNIVSEASVNMEVLAQPNGTFCICFQHLASSSKSQKNSQSSEGEEISCIQYSVCVVHHGKILHCHGPSISVSSVTRARVFFTMLGEYLLAYLPGHFTHLLNIGIEWEPGHHVLWHDSASPVSSPSSGKIFQPVNYIREKSVPSISAGAVVFDCGSQCGYKLSVERSMLEALFSSSTSPATREAILHYAVVHQKDLAFVKGLFEALAHDVFSPELSTLMEEFLIGSLYSSLRRRLERRIMRYVSYTASNKSRGQMENNASEERLCTISYVRLVGVSVGILDHKPKAEHPPEDLWENLARHLLDQQGEPPVRLTCEDVRKDIIDADIDFDEYVQVGEPADNPSFFRRISIAAKSAFASGKTPPEPQPRTMSSPSPRSELILGAPPPFLSHDQEIEDPIQKRVIAENLQAFAGHLCEQMKKESRSKIRNIATEYVSAQVQQSRQLCHLIWSALATEDTPAFLPLHIPASDDELKLFFMLERYVLALDQVAFPQPAGFQLYFTCLAYRCLQLRLFLQYVDRSVLHLTPEFVVKLIDDLDDGSPNVQTKLQVISRMDKRSAVECLKHWDHPVSHDYLAQNYAASCLALGSSESLHQARAVSHSLSSYQGGSTSSFSAAGLPFPPLATFVALLEKKDAGLSSGQSHLDVHIDSRYLEDVALHNTRAEQGTFEPTSYSY